MSRQTVKHPMFACLWEWVIAPVGAGRPSTAANSCAVSGGL
jgi:hypothetical protein